MADRVNGLGQFRPDLGELDLGRVEVGGIAETVGTVVLISVGAVILGIITFAIFPIGLGVTERRMKKATTKLRDANGLAIDAAADFEQAEEVGAGIIDSRSGKGCQIIGGPLSPRVEERLVASCLAYKAAQKGFSMRGCQFTPELEAEAEEDLARQQVKLEKVRKELAETRRDTEEARLEAEETAREIIEAKVKTRRKADAAAGRIGGKKRGRERAA